MAIDTSWVVFGYTLAFLLAGHAIADTWFQPAWLSRMKRSRDPDERWQALFLHGMVHALFVSMGTGVIILTLLEMLLHPLIDHAKARGLFGLKTDQALHALCKVLWAAVYAWGLRDACPSV